MLRCSQERCHRDAVVRACAIDDDMDTDINVDAVHVLVYIHGRDPKGRGQPSSTQEPDGIEYGPGDGRHWVLSLAHDTGRVHT